MADLVFWVSRDDPPVHWGELDELIVIGVRIVSTMFGYSNDRLLYSAK